MLNNHSITQKQLTKGSKFFDNVNLPVDLHNKIISSIQPQKNSFLSNPTPESNKEIVPVPEPTKTLINPVLDEKSDFSSANIVGNSENLFYQQDQPVPEEDLRSTIVLKEGQNPSFRNIEDALFANPGKSNISLQSRVSLIFCG